MAKTSVNKTSAAKPSKGKVDDKKKPAKEEVKKKPAFTREMDMKFGISDLASALDLDETYTRAKLRQHGVEKKAKGGSAYGWNSRDDLQTTVKLLQGGTPKKDAKKVETKSVKKSAAPAKPSKKAASSDTPKLTGMPKGTGKDKAVAPLNKNVKAPNDEAIDKSAREVAKQTKKLNK